MPNNRLINANEVIDIAFSRDDQIEHSNIIDPKIESTELRFLAPVFAELYTAMIEGKYQEFVDDFIKTPLAYFIKYTIIPELSVKIGNAGIVKNKNPNSDSASSKDINIIRNEAREMANILLKKAINHVENNPMMFPEYDSKKNVSHKIAISGGIII